MTFPAPSKSLGVVLLTLLSLLIGSTGSSANTTDTIFEYALNWQPGADSSPWQVDDLLSLLKGHHNPPPVSVFFPGIIATIATGQTESLLLGDDGSYQMGRKRSYTDHGNGTITDNNTGLMWISDPADAQVGQKETWSDASQSCEDLVYAEHSDWRLPTVYELETLCHLGQYDPAIDNLFAVESSTYWTSTLYAQNPSLAWQCHFKYGKSSWDFQSAKCYFRPVRQIGSSTKAERYTDHGDGTITDNNTGLMWVASPEAAGVAGTFSWADAVDACETLIYASYSDWRLPNLNELLSLSDRTAFNPAIDSLFTCPSLQFWSSTVDASFQATYRWYVSFLNGGSNWENPSMKFAVRPVRAGYSSLSPSKSIQP